MDLMGGHNLLEKPVWLGGESPSDRLVDAVVLFQHAERRPRRPVGDREARD